MADASRSSTGSNARDTPVSTSSIGTARVEYGSSVDLNITLNSEVNGGGSPEKDDSVIEAGEWLYYTKDGKKLNAKLENLQIIRQAPVANVPEREEIALPEEDRFLEGTFHRSIHCIENWFGTWIPRKNFNPRGTFTAVSSVLQEKFLALPKDKLMTEEIEVSPHETITGLLILVFCQIFNQEDTDIVHKNMNTVSELLRWGVEHEQLSIDIGEGLVHLYSAVEAYRQTTLINKPPPHGINQFRAASYAKNVAKVFQLLPPLALNALKACRAIFLGTCRRFEEQISLMEEVMLADPEFLEYKIQYLFIMKMFRKQKDRFLLPYPEEEKVLIQCINMRRCFPMVRLLTCMYVADVVKNRPINGITSEDIFLDSELRVSFPTHAKAFDFVKRVTREVLETYGYSVRVNLHIVDCVTTGLPYEMRDYDLAKECLRSALTTNPKSSKGNHRMAVILIYEKKYDDAEEYCKRGIGADGRNFPVCLDYLQLLFRDMSKNTEKLAECFGKFMDYEAYWTLEQKGTMYAMRGLFNFAIEEFNVALEYWVMSSEANAKEPNQTIKGVGSAARRFGWDESVFSVHNLLKHIKRVLASNGDSINIRLNKGQAAVLESVAWPNREQESGTSRGRGAASGGSRGGHFNGSRGSDRGGRKHNQYSGREGSGSPKPGPSRGGQRPYKQERKDQEKKAFIYNSQEYEGLRSSSVARGLQEKKEKKLSREESIPSPIFTPQETALVFGVTGRGGHHGARGRGRGRGRGKNFQGDSLGNDYVGYGSSKGCDYSKFVDDDDD